MHRSFGRPWLSGIALALAVSSCQANRSVVPVQVPPANGASVQTPALHTSDNANTTGQASVVVDLAALKSARRQLLGLGFTDTANIQQARLTAEGPGIVMPLSATAAWSLTAGTAVAPSTLSLAVPAGKNRVFTLEGLDTDGHVIASIRSLASLATGTTTTLAINANTDAAARTLYDLLFAMGNGGDYGSARAGISSQDLTAKLLAHVNKLTQLDEGTNQYAGQAPRWFRDRELAGSLLAKGLGVLDVAPTDAISRPAGATYTVDVYDGGLPASGAQVTLFDPTTATPIETNGLGEVVFNRVPPGSWAVRATLGPKTTWGTIDAHANESDRIVMSLTPQRVAGSLTAPLPTVVMTLAGDTTLVSTGQAATDRDGFGNARGTFATLSPYGVAVAPDGVIYASSDNIIWRISPQGKVTFLAGPKGLTGTTPNSFSSPNSALNGAQGIAFDSHGDLIVVDALANKIRKISLADPAHPVLSLVIGGGSGSYKDGPAGEAPIFLPAGTFAAFNAPSALAIAPDDTIYIADTGNNCIRKINMSDPAHPVATTLAGNIVNGAPVQGYHDDVDPTKAQFSMPSGLALDKTGTTLYVADRGNLRLRTITLATGEVKTFAGSGRYQSTDGVGILADFSGMYGLAFDANGLLLVTDGDSIRSVDVSTARVKKLAGVGYSFNSPTFADGPLLQARFASVRCLATDANGNVYAPDKGSSLLRKLVP